MNRTVLILAVVVVLGIGGYVLLNQSGGPLTETALPDTASTDPVVEATEEAATDAVDATENAVEEAATSLVEQGTDAAEQASDAINETIEQATDAATGAVETATEQAGDAASSVAEQGTEALANLADQVTGQAQGLGNAGEALFQSMTDSGLLSPEGFDFDKALAAFQAGGLGEGVMTQVEELLAQMRDNPDTFNDTLETLKNLVTG